MNNKCFPWIIQLRPHVLFDFDHFYSLLLTFTRISYLKQVLIKSIDIFFLYVYAIVTYRMEKI